jgi:hypothetical protein
MLTVSQLKGAIALDNELKKAGSALREVDFPRHKACVIPAANQGAQDSIAAAQVALTAAVGL